MIFLVSIFNVPWHWAFSGAMIALVMFLLLFAGRTFGVSSSFDALCTLAGAGKKVKYFQGDWRAKSWMFAFLLGTVGGSAIATIWMQSPEPVQISQATRDDLAAEVIHEPT